MHIAYYVALCFTLHGVSSLLSASFIDYYKTEETVSKKKMFVTGRAKAWATWCKRVEWDYTCNSAVYASAIFYLYACAVLEFYGDLETRWTGISYYTTQGISFHIGSSIYETICYALSGKESVFYLHHVVTLGCCSSMLFTGRAQFWCCVLGLVEGSNVPLCFLTVMRAIPALRASTLYTVNGALLWLAYVVLRVPIPLAMYLLGKDLVQHSKAKGGPAWVVADEDQNMKWAAFIFISGTFLWLLSMMWFKKITDGILKAIMPPAESPKKKAD